MGRNKSDDDARNSLARPLVRPAPRATFSRKWRRVGACSYDCTRGLMLSSCLNSSRGARIMKSLPRTAMACLVVIALTSCSRSARDELQRQTGILPCSQASVRLVQSEYPYLTKFQISVPRSCRPTFQDSLQEAGSSECAELIRIHGSCAYTFHNRTVMAEKQSQQSGVEVYRVTAG